jgi:hypothetical protein
MRSRWFASCIENVNNGRSRSLMLDAFTPGRLPQMSSAAASQPHLHAQPVLSPAPDPRTLAKAHVVFAIIVLVVCLWVLTLPVFPSQDGPMHRYYAHALGAVFAHQPAFQAYVVRHPFPPYATQYITLIGLFHLFSFDMAEKLLTCLEIVCFAYGFRACAVMVGPAGAWLSLLIAPLLLPWYLMMGFFNYSIGVGIALFAVANWLRLDTRRSAIVFYAFWSVLLIFSHPVPVVLLLAFISADLVRRSFFTGPQPGGWFRANRVQLAALLLTLGLASYPALAIDKTKTASTLSDLGFHLPFVRTALLLTGLSPYNTRSHALLINIYRLCAYLLLALALYWGVRAFRLSLSRRQYSVGASFFVYAVLFVLALPFMPDRMNGGVFFATRMVIMVWIFSLLAAAAYQDVDRKFQQVCIALGIVFTLATLLPAEQRFRPMARSVKTVEDQTVPSGISALLLTGPALTESIRAENDLAVDPLLWANILPFVRENDLVLDAPWMELSVSPLRIAPDAHLLANASPLIEQRGAPHRLTEILPAPDALDLIRRSNMIMYAGTRQELAGGLLGYLGPDDAARFDCRYIQRWSLACFRRSGG